MAAIAVALLLLAILGSGAVWRMSRARAARDRAEREAVRAEAAETETVSRENPVPVVAPVHRDALYGHVTDMTGAPIAGARVRCGAAHAVSDADGAYRVEAVPPIEVSAEGYAPLFLRDGPFTGERDLVLTRGGSVRAVVVRLETGKPMIGVNVRLWGIGDRLLGEQKTDADGVATFVVVSSLGFHHGPGTKLGKLRLHDAGSYPAAVEVLMPAEGATVEYRLTRWATATLVGRVVDQAGQPVGDAQVFSHWRQGPPDTPVDKHGYYRLVVAARTDDRIDTAVFAERPGLEDAASHEVRVRAGRTTQVPDLVVGEPVVTEVVVVDEDEAPVPGAGVSFRADTEGAVTDTDGRARLYYRRGEKVYVRPREHAFTVAPAAPEVRVVVYRGEPIAGQVVWKDELPVANALVRLGHAARTYTDAQGGFRFEYATGATEIAASIVYGANHGWVTVIGRAKDVPAGATDVRIVLDRKGFAPVAQMRGTVEDDVTGQLVARFRVKFYKDDRVLVSRKVGVGRFEAGLAEGEWLLFVGGPGYIGQNHRIRIVPGVPIPPRKLRLQPATTVSGRIRSRQSLKGGRIEFLKTNNAWKGGQARIDADGSYWVEGLVPGTYLARVTVGQSYFADPVWRTVEVKSGRAQIRFDFDVDPAGALQVMIEDFEKLRGNDVYGVLTIKDAKGVERVRLVGPHAMFPNTWHLPPGKYSVRIKSRPATWTKEVTVATGRQTEIVFPQRR